MGLHHLFSKRFFTVRLQQVDLNGNPRKGILNMFHFLQRLLLLPILSACAHSHTHTSPDLTFFAVTAMFLSTGKLFFLIWLQFTGWSALASLF